MEQESAINLFNEISNKYPLQKLANILGLHKGTILRWQQKKDVPNNYKADFLRILGLETKESFSIKDKDQYYTKKDIANECILKFKKIAKELSVNLDEYCFIEPSAGNGSFYNLLPPQKRIGIDIDPKGEEIIKNDYLKWFPLNNKKYIVIGNPPFGLRGHLALQFINHSHNFADMVAFILPQLFESDGKGSNKKRVLGYKLAYSEKLKPNSFEYPDGKEIKIHTIFQVWTKINIDKIKLPNKKTCSQYISVYSLSDGGMPHNTRNKNMIEKCDIYLPSTTYSGMKAYKTFYDLPHKRGYGVVIHKNKKEIKDILQNNDWNKTAFSSSNSAINLRTSLIENVVIKAGYFDKNLTLWK